MRREPARARAADGAGGHEHPAASSLGGSRVERYAPSVAGALVCAPTLLAHYPPMSDLPLHEGIVGVMRHFFDPTFVPPGLYVWSVGHPNQLFHLAAWLLSFVVSTRWSVKIVVAAAQFAIFVGGARLADHMGRSRWGALALAPLALGFTYFWGLVANLLGFAALLFALPTIDRYASTPTRKGFAHLLFALAVVYLAHESALVIACGTLFVFASLRPGSLRVLGARMTPLAIAAAVVFADLARQTPEDVDVPTRFLPLADKLAYLPRSLFGAHDEVPLLLVFALGVLGAIASFGVRSRSDAASGAPTDDARGLRALALRHRFEVVAAALLATYLAAPFNFHAATMLHERFLGPAWALFVLCAARRSTSLTKLLAVSLPIAVILLAWPQFADADATYRDLDDVLMRLPRGSSVTSASVDRSRGIRLYSAGLGPARSVAVAGGRPGESFLSSPIAPVQIRPEWRWREYELRVEIRGTRALEPTYDLEKFGWVVAQSSEAATRRLLRSAFAPDADLVYERGEWMLFRSTHATVPPASRERPAPFGAETLTDRLARVARRELEKATPPTTP